jgi:hypothetical protein
MEAWNVKKMKLKREIRRVMDERRIEGAKGKKRRRLSHYT